MATLRANPPTPLLPKQTFSHHPSPTSKPPTQAKLCSKSKKHFKPLQIFHQDSKSSGGGNLASRPVSCLPTEEESGVAAGEDSHGHGHGQEEYLVREFGWGVRKMAMVGEEFRRVAQVQAEAFHVPVALFNDFSFNFFRAEVLSALVYRVRNSPPDRYACLVAEATNVSDSPCAPFERIVGVVDVTVQNDKDVLNHLEGANMYLYVSGIAVLATFRRQKVATVLLKACETLSLLWRYQYLVLRAYEDDHGARNLYTKAGYKEVSRDPIWITWLGKKRRVLMIKRSTLYDKMVMREVTIV